MQATIASPHFPLTEALDTAAAIGDDRATIFSPGNGSITIFETDGTRLSLIEKGREAETVVR